MKLIILIAKYLLPLNYIGNVCSVVCPPSLTNPTSFLSPGTKTCSLVSSSTTLPLLQVKISQISLLWLLLLLEEDQIRDTHANQDMMWHIVKWASIMHTASSRGCVSSNASYFSLPSDATGGDAAAHCSDTDWQTRVGKRHKKWTDETSRCSKVFVNTHFIFQCSTHAWHSEQVLLQTARGNTWNYSVYTYQLFHCVITLMITVRTFFYLIVN